MTWHEKRARADVLEWHKFWMREPDYTQRALCVDANMREHIIDLFTKALKEAHAVGRNKALAEVMPVLEFTTHAAEHLFGKVNPQPNMCSTFYHTLTYEGDVELVEKCKRARELLERLNDKAGDK